MENAFPNLTHLLNRDEMWNAVKDFDALMKSLNEKVRLASSSGESGQAAKLLLNMAQDHFHLLLVGQYKVTEIGRGIVAALLAGNDSVFFNLARAFVEHTAAIAYQLTTLEKAVLDIPKKPNLDNLKLTIARHHKKAKTLYYNERAAVHVNDMIKELVRHDPASKADYDALCEYVHPNYGSNQLVSSGHLGLGEIRAHVEELGPIRSKAIRAVERCAALINLNLTIQATTHLVRISSWITISSEKGSKLSQVFSTKDAISGDGSSKEMALCFPNARTHFEAMESLYNYLKNKNLDPEARRLIGTENDFMYEQITTKNGTLWVKYDQTLPIS